MNNIAFYSDYDYRLFEDIFFKNSTKDYDDLFRLLISKGFTIHTLDIFKKLKQKPEICIFLDMPKKKINRLIDTSLTKSIVILREGEHTIKENYDYTKLNQFDNVLTFKENLIDNKKFFFQNCGRYYQTSEVYKVQFQKKKFCILINGNKISNAKNELYSLRYKIIKWFEKYHPKEFDLYGWGWDKTPEIASKNRFGIFELFVILVSKIIGKNIFIKKLNSYKGEAGDKINKLSKYKFCICFENGISESHVDEKIIDCFNARVIPVYFGAPDIKKIVPENCFIDFKKFKSLDEMYIYLKSIDKKEYEKYINNIENYLMSDLCFKYFSIESWLDSVYSSILRLSRN